jgi:hypothetical protein
VTGSTPTALAVVIAIVAGAPGRILALTVRFSAEDPWPPAAFGGHQVDMGPPAPGSGQQKTPLLRGFSEYRYRDSKPSDRNLDSQTLPANRDFRYSAEPPSWGR